MKILAKALLRLDGLSHVLAWTRDPVMACKDAASLDFVELPRLKMRFEGKADGPGGKACISDRVLRIPYVVESRKKEQSPEIDRDPWVHEKCWLP